MPVKREIMAVKFDESKLKERDKKLSVLIKMSNLLSSSMSLQDLLTAALGLVLEYFNLESGRIYLMTDGDPYLRLAAYKGMDITGLEKVSIYEGFSGKAFRTKTFINQRVSELEDKKRASILLSRGFKNIICVPLIIMDKVEGVMNLASTRTIRFDQGKIDLLSAMGNQIAVAANNASLYQDLNKKIQKLKEKEEMIKYFAYSITHDPKSPAIGIFGLARRLKEKYGETLDERGKAYCDQIMKTAEQLVSLVERINTYSSAKEAPLNLEKVNVKEITESIRNELSMLLKERRIRWSEPETLPEIVADKLAISRVFRNLVDNALKYGGGKMHELTIGCEENDSFHVFSLSDDGVGIKTENKSKLFEPFQRDETSKGTIGCGLGLAIVREITKRHQGKVWVDSHIEKGTTFYVAISKDLNGKI